MSVSIRLSRGGAKKRPYYRIVVADSRASRDGKYLEQIGTYNPLLAKDSPERVKIDADRISHWLSVGAQPSDRVLRFLDAAGIRRSENPAEIDIVIASYDRTFAYRKLQIAFDAIWYERRAFLVSTNPDRYCPFPGGRGEPDCASITAAIEACTRTTCAALYG